MTPWDDDFRFYLKTGTMAVFVSQFCKQDISLNLTTWLTLFMRTVLTYFRILSTMPRRKKAGNGIRTQTEQKATIGLYLIEFKSNVINMQDQKSEGSVTGLN